MTEVIELMCDSSDEEEPLPPTARNNARTTPKNNPVICLLDDDDDDDDDDRNTTLKDKKAPLVSQESTSSSSYAVAYPKRTTRHQDFEDNDSDSDDSLTQYKPSGLSRIKTAMKEKKNPPNPLLASSFTNKEVRTAAPVVVAATTKTPIINPYARKRKTPPSTSALAIATSSTRRVTLSPLTAPSTSAQPPIRNPYTTPSSATTPTTSQPSTRNPYAKKPKTSTTASTTTTASSDTTTTTTIFYPTGLTDNAKTYPDIRAKLSLALWKYCRTLTRQSHNRAKLDQMVKKLVALATTAEYPIRSLEEYLQRFLKQSHNNRNNGLGELQEQLQQGGFDRISTPVGSSNSNGCYYTIAEACLVACYTRVVQQQHSISTSTSKENHNMETSLSQKQFWISLEWLLPQIDQRLQPACPGSLFRPQDPDGGVAFYQQHSTISAEYKQIEKLTCEPSVCLKPHTLKGQPYFELTPLGYQTAQNLRSQVYPAPSGCYRCSNEIDSDQYSNIVLGVDNREGGGASKVLHAMCNKLDWTHLPYFVAPLTIGDYVFFHQNKLLPLLVERKSVQDVAQSIFDGRWERQKERMYHGQFVFGYDGSSRLAFIIEGKQERHQVTGGFIGNASFQVTLEQLNSEIQNLEKQGFDVLRTTSPEHSMLELSRWAKRVATQVQRGHLQAQYTYQEFKQKVKEIPKGTDFSRLAKYYYQEQRQSKQASPITLLASSDDCGDDDDDDPQDRKPTNQNPKRLTYEKVPTKKPPILNQRTTTTTTTTYEQVKKQRIQSQVDYSTWTNHQLQEECVKCGLSKSGAHADLVARLQGPKPPSLWLQRKNQGEYVPARYNCGATAILVAMLLLHQEHPQVSDGFPRDQIYVRAEAICITKNPFSGGTTQTGPYHYDGWANMKFVSKLHTTITSRHTNDTCPLIFFYFGICFPQLLQGDPPLVAKKKNRFRLTKSCAIAGFPLAEVLHEWCHAHDHCKCQEL